jgi:hypothetical protein
VEIFQSNSGCVAGANSDLHHDTPYDSRLLSPLRRPPRALVNPTDVQSIISKIFPDIMSGIMAPHQYSGIKNVIQEGKDIHLLYSKKIEELFKEYEKKVKQTFEEMSDFTILEKMEHLCPKIRELIASNNHEASKISVEDLLGSLKKIKHYVTNNLEMSSTIINLKTKRMKKDNDEYCLSSIKSLTESFKKQIKMLEKIGENDRMHLLPDGWTIEDLSQLMPCVKITPIQYTKLISKEKDTLQNFVKDNDSQLLKNKKIEAESKNKTFLLKNLLTDTWTTSHGIAYQNAITERREFLKRFSADMDTFIKEIEDSIIEMTDLKKKGDTITNKIVDFTGQYNLLSEFAKELNYIKPYRKELYKMSQLFLKHREPSAKIAALCLGDDHQGVYGRGSRDELILSYKNNHTVNFDLDETFDAELETDNLVKLLKDKFILPLSSKYKKNANVQPKIMGQDAPFANTSGATHNRIIPLEAANYKISLNSNDKRAKLASWFSMHQPPIIAFPVMDIQLNNQLIPRRPSNASPKMLDIPSSNNRQVSFTIDQVKESSYVTKLFKNIKDGLQIFNPSNSDKRSQPCSRSSSYATAPEITDEQMDNLEYTTAISRENARLRAMIVKARQEEKMSYIQNVIAINKKVGDKERNKDRIDAVTNMSNKMQIDSKITKWVTEQQQMSDIGLNSVYDSISEKSM